MPSWCAGLEVVGRVGPGTRDLGAFVERCDGGVRVAAGDGDEMAGLLRECV